MTAIDEAKTLIYGERHDEYGPAAEEFRRVADGWASILGANVLPSDVALCMAWLKIVRESYKHKRDNIVDAIGYLALYEDVFTVEVMAQAQATSWLLRCEYTYTGGATCGGLADTHGGGTHPFVPPGAPKPPGDVHADEMRFENGRWVSGDGDEETEGTDGASGADAVPAADAGSRPACPDIEQAAHLIIITPQQWPWKTYTDALAGICREGHPIVLSSIAR